MGDSSVSCALTGVALTADRVALIPLAPAWFVEGGRDRPSPPRGARIISNEGASALFGPLTLPIFGRLDGYGSVYEIETSSHTAFLEKRLGVDAETFARAVCDGDTLPGVARFARRVRLGIGRSPRRALTWFGGLYGCYVDRDAWDAFSKSLVGEDGSSRYSVWDDGWFNPTNLHGMGFRTPGKDAAGAVAALGKGDLCGGRYHTPYTHPELPELVAWCDMHMSSEIVWRGKVIQSVYHPCGLDAALRKRGAALPVSAVAWAQQTPVEESNLRDEGKQYRELVASHRAARKAVAECPEIAFRLVRDTVPESVRKARLTEALRNARAFFRGKPLTPVHRVDTTLYERTFCDDRWHVDVSPAGIVPVRCDCGGKLPSLGFELMPREAVEALRAAGWKPAPRAEPFLNLPYQRVFAPELLHIYRGKLYGEFLSEAAALRTFIGWMHAANRLLMPSFCGYQYGNHPAAARIAQFAVDAARARVRACAGDDHEE